MALHQRTQKMFVAVFLIIFLVKTHGSPKEMHNHLKDLKKASDPKQRSYIDIDATDPFKVPKHSQYIDRPVPDWVGHGSERNEYDDGNDLPPKHFSKFPYDMKQRNTNHNIDQSRQGFREFKQDENEDERDRFEEKDSNDREQANEAIDFNNGASSENAHHPAKLNLRTRINKKGLI
ncbi:uncharacterized protein LOC101240922 isoform X2 [Hydra vulgaris]|uniref:Uncharacterized protein LOC101240922 isoform X2 n=1 Tax=Hydra vulgaris TaxID=6087 RepID=A0ABM4BDB6_HYDVU